MVVPDAEIMSPGEVESPLQSDQHQDRNNIQLGRQSSIYSLTLDEFQHTSGKNFGSMNMDEFLNSIWTAEENQAQAQAHFHPSAAGNGGGGGQFMMGINTNSVESNMIARQQSLSRQGSLTLPGSLSRKTVDEVWSEIRKAPGSGSGSAQRQPTYGEMTLEDFLVNAGVVREQNQPNVVQVQPVAIAPFGLYPNGSNRVVGPPHGPAHMVRPVMAPPARFSGKRAGPCQQPPPPYYPNMVGNGGGGYGQGLGTGSPASPVSSDGIATSQLESGNQYEMDMGAIRNGRGRIIDGSVEKVVERRQRRMIKNRESAARSRARKQAYTVELEAELNMLKEENAQLKQTLAEIERKRKQQFFEEMRMKSVPKGQKMKDKLRRTTSCST
ncbi:putative transcription factor bZIP family [Helianthus annuus]|uniref:Transcription factor bZIP family n=1 Tax=Helianthus annuus TaxID=4232 RepID=A0A9K3ND31_HELAN|nr:protein ABSCISIC ACID-INSENSITIVE 5 [Helianthus annuus]XP_021977946.1 protein ABSCISIC ACID-INSENSITIVE 5 [Helianthus annuus]KAF5795982.1 putative transcription factor bZIP family [Helianthus annuus]